MAKTHLNTSEVFAWIAVILLLSSVFEKVGIWLFDRFCAWKPKCKVPVRNKANMGKNISDGQRMKYQISKAYGERQIWDNLELELEKGKVYTIQAPSGRGKTTLLRVLAGLENNAETEKLSRKEAGYLHGEPRECCSMLFQEDRLLLQESPLVNVELCVGSVRREEIWQQLRSLIPELSGEQTCEQLSGGMRRRVCLVRALMADSDLVLLDEPFAGLDEDTKKQAIDYILQMQKGRTILVVTHQEKDAKMLNSTHFNM